MLNRLLFKKAYTAKEFLDYSQYIFVKKMAKSYRVDYYLIYIGGGRLSQSTTLNMEFPSENEAIRRIKGTNNLTPNVKEIAIIRISPS